MIDTKSLWRWLEGWQVTLFKEDEVGDIQVIIKESYIIKPIGWVILEVHFLENTEGLEVFFRRED